MANAKKATTLAEKELEKADKQLEAFTESVKEATQNRDEVRNFDAAPKAEVSQKELEFAPGAYLKPKRVINTRMKFNEKFASAYEYDKQYVQFVAEHNEVKGDRIEIWTHKYGGKPAEFWEVPTNKPVWGPRYLAEQIRSKYYHRLKTEDRMTSAEGGMQYYGAMAVDTTVQRLDARPVSDKRSVFMGKNDFRKSEFGEAA